MILSWMTESNWCYINSSKTLPAANQVRLRDTSGPKLLDTSCCETLSALKLLDTSRPEVFGQVRARDKSSPETCPAPRQFRPRDKSSPESSPAQKCLAPRYFCSFSAFLLKPFGTNSKNQTMNLLSSQFENKQTTKLKVLIDHKSIFFFE